MVVKVKLLRLSASVSKSRTERLADRRCSCELVRAHNALGRRFLVTFNVRTCSSGCVAVGVQLPNYVIVHIT